MKVVRKGVRKIVRRVNCLQQCLHISQFLKLWTLHSKLESMMILPGHMLKQWLDLKLRCTTSLLVMRSRPYLTMGLGNLPPCLQVGKPLDADGCAPSSASLMEPLTDSKVDLLQKDSHRGQDLTMMRHMPQQSNGPHSEPYWHLPLLRIWRLNLLTFHLPSSMETLMQKSTWTNQKASLKALQIRCLNC